MRHFDKGICCFSGPPSRYITRALHRASHGRSSLFGLALFVPCEFRISADQAETTMVLQPPIAAALRWTFRHDRLPLRLAPLADFELGTTGYVLSLLWRQFV